jgi:hypothetical protein
VDEKYDAKALVPEVYHAFHSTLTAAATTTTSDTMEAVFSREHGVLRRL